MRYAAALTALAAAIALTTTPSVAAPKDAALDSGDWLRAASLGASAADVVRALQAKGRLAGMVPEELVVTIGPDNSVDVVALKPLPPLDPVYGRASTARTGDLAGSGFGFAARRGSIILYPAYARSLASKTGP